MSIRSAVSAAVAASLAVVGLAGATMTPAHADDPHAIVSTQHKPGILAVRELVPADQKMPDGSPHPCAGRYFVYRDHADPVYLTQYDGKPRMMVVAGSAVVPADKVCMRLGPDAYQGRETSRMVVPNDPAYAFLGKPGRILWYAPGTRTGNSSPIWPGIGAFDPEHESKPKPDIMGNRVQLKLADFSGPGRMNIFTDTVGTPPRDLVNSAEQPDNRIYEISAGGHAHMSFAFTKSGIYHTTWQGTYTTLDAESRIVPQSSAPEDIVWLIGTNEDVGLPAQFSRTFDQPQTTAEKIREQAGLTDPHDDNDGLAGSTGSGDPEEPPADAGNIEDALKWGWNGGRVAPAPVTYVADGAQLHAQGTDGKSPWVEVSDSITDLACLPDTPANSHLRRALTGGWLWATGRSGTPGLTVDFSGLPDIDQSKPVRMTAEIANSMDAPAALGTWDGDTFTVAYRSDGAASGDMTVPAGKPYSADVAFAKPGIYNLTLTIIYPKTDGSDGYVDTSTYFAVGNGVINAVRERANIADRLEENTRAGQTCAAAPTPPDPGEKPVDPVDPPAPAPQPETPVTPAPSAECLVRAAWAGQAPTAILNVGHMDIGPSENGEAIVRDTADPSAPKDHASGTFAFELPDGTIDMSHTSLPDDVKEAMKAAYYIPEVQEHDRVWAGFSTQHLPEGSVKDNAVDLRVTPRVMPQGARIVWGAGGTALVPWQTYLDTDHPELVRHYTGPVHEHPFTLVSQPGIYVIDFTFEWADAASGERRSTSLRATYVVGSQAKTTFDKLQGHPVDEACAGVEVPAPGSEPAQPAPDGDGENPDPSQPEKPQPDPSQPDQPEEPHPGADGRPVIDPVPGDDGPSPDQAGIPHASGAPVPPVNAGSAKTDTTAGSSLHPAAQTPGVGGSGQFPQALSSAFPTVAAPASTSLAGGSFANAPVLGPQQTAPSGSAEAGAQPGPQASAQAGATKDKETFSKRVKDDLPTAAASRGETGATNGWLAGLLLGAGGMAGLLGLGALIAAFIIALKRRRAEQ
ncbi:MAG: choice-of-anchor M domain-containing protein [Actinomycetaceae bacterium]|nr:choice-of-anchor M domain-containing protein [Actinomycetaceae bacterium]